MRPSIVFAGVLSLSLLAGCATTSQTIGGHTFNNLSCALMGAAIGAGSGGAVAGVGGAGMGALGGAVMSQYVCGASADFVDSDGDWIADQFDECPDTPAGEQVDRRGCALDGDGDGVADKVDACPDTYGLGNDGCPIDTDGDGFADGADACPEQAAPDTEDGCPIQALFIEAVRFDFDSDVINPISQAVLDARAVAVMRENPDIRLRIEGHTDDYGNDRYNQKLSLRRAEAVRAYLVSQGIDELRMTIAGYGESHPADTNATRVGRANNRRVEFVIR